MSMIFGYPIVNKDEEQDGGMLLPETTYIDVTRNGRLYDFIRWLGNKIIRFGARVYGLGFEKKEIHPRRALWEAIKEHKP